MLTLIAIAAQSVLTVFAAASLHAAFSELGRQFGFAHPGLTIRFNYNGSHILEAQLEAGAQADVFASADKRWMNKAVEAGIAVKPTTFATNQMVVAVSSQSNIRVAQDLAKSAERVILCVEAAPCGRYARNELTEMDADPAFGKNFSSLVLRNVVSQELDVEAVLEKVRLGEADAGIVYRSDVASQPQSLRVIALPKLRSSPVAYYMAVVRSNAIPPLANQFVQFVRSRSGRQILRQFGFTTAP
jgi:molybdate transport system substrate-binding protein